MKRILLYSLSFLLGSLCHAQISLKDTVHKGGVFNNRFTENKGQVGDFNSNPRPDILFSGSTKNMSYFFRQQGISYQLYKVDTWKQKSSILGTDKFLSLPDKDSLKKQSLIPDKMSAYRLDINWLNCNKQPSIITGNAIGGYTNYYLAVCPNGVNGVKTYQSIRYKNIYKGIDLVWYEKNNALKYDYIVAAGANYKHIQSQINGANKISLNEQGELIINTPFGAIIEEAPLVIQQGKKLRAKWLIQNNTISFDIEDVNTKLPFVIDPGVRNWGTYYGGAGGEWANASCTDSDGDVYFAGDATNYNNTIIATLGTFQGTYPNLLCSFLVKLNSQGQRLWGTYYAGDLTLTDNGLSCATDPNGNVYLSGATNTSTNVGTSGSHQVNFGGGETDAFLVKFDPSGTRLWGTYYGGTGLENVSFCTVDVSGNVYLTGSSTSIGGTVIATPNSHQTTNAGGNTDAFLVKFNSQGQRQWGTYYGGSGVEIPYSCATDASGNIYFTGYTTSNIGTTIATVGSHQSTGDGNHGDAFLVKFNSLGQRLWATYYGDIAYDFGFACACDQNNNVYIAGYTDAVTNPTLIATPNSHQPFLSGGYYDAFLAKFNSNGVRQWGTFYGGSGNDFAKSLAIDAYNNVYMVGGTDSGIGSPFSTPGTQQQNLAGWTDAFLVCFGSDGRRHWGTYYGTPNPDGASACSVDKFGNVYMAGRTDLETTGLLGSVGCHQAVSGGVANAFFAQFNNCIIPSPNNPSPILNLVSNPNSLCSGESVTLNVAGASSYIWIPGSLESSSLSLVANADINYTVTGTDGQGCRNELKINIPVTPTPTLGATPFFYLCSGNATLNASGAETYVWLPDNISGSIAMVSPPATSNYTVIGANGTCTSSAVSIVSIGIAPPLYISASNLSGCQNTCFTFSTASSEFSPYTFFWGEDAPANALLNSHCYTTSGNYEVIAHATFSSGCSVISANTLSITIFPIPSSEIEINAEKEFSNGEPITFRNLSQGAQTYHWVFGDQSNFPVSYSTSDVEHIYAKPGNYCVKLIVTDTVFKCTDTTIQCIDVLCGSKINIPNIFTPNGDGANDVFTFTTKCIKSLSCSIYDRWGNPVHSWNDINGWWDGRTTSGLLCSAGTYFFVLEYTTEANINMKKSGNFFLMD